MSDSDDDVDYGFQHVRPAPDRSLAGVVDRAMLKELFRHHVDSFDYMLDMGLRSMLQHIPAIQVTSDGNTLTIKFKDAHIDFPRKKDNNRLYPWECRRYGSTYKGKLRLKISLMFGDVESETRVSAEHVPIMLKSHRCYLQGNDSVKIRTLHEDTRDMGGYFIIKGEEQVVQLHALPKQNYPRIIQDESFCRMREKGLLNIAIVIRCVRKDLSSSTVRLHGKQTGSPMLWCRMGNQEFLFPVLIILKALDDGLYDAKGIGLNEIIGDTFEYGASSIWDKEIYSREYSITHIGKAIQSKLPELIDQDPAVVTETFLRDILFVHLNKNKAKVNLLIFMLQQLFRVQLGGSGPDDLDSLHLQEAMLPGHLITIYLKERLHGWLQNTRKRLQVCSDLATNLAAGIRSEIWTSVEKVLAKSPPRDICSGLEILLSKGTLQKKFLQELPQITDLTSSSAAGGPFHRYMSRFRAVRGINGPAPGFVFPLSNESQHMNCACRITSPYTLKGRIKDYGSLRDSIRRFLRSHHMYPLRSLPPKIKGLDIHLDGEVIGTADVKKVEEIVASLRASKLERTIADADDLEIAYVRDKEGGPYPGLFLFTNAGRFARPVRNISGGTNELIGPFEQVYMKIGSPDMVGVTHEEIAATKFEEYCDDIELFPESDND